MYQRLNNLLIIVAIIFWITPAVAMEFQPLGPDAASMGGAAVASSKGPYAGYNNPALLPEHKNKAAVALSAKYGYREYGIAEHVDNLADIDIDETISQLSNEIVDPLNPGVSTPPSGVADDVALIKSELSSLSNQNGILMMPGASLAIQVNNFGFGAYGVSEAAGIAVVDDNRLDLIFEYEDGGSTYYIEYDEETNGYITSNLSEYEARSIEYAMDQGLTYIQVNGLAYIEIPISYGHKFQTGIGDINLGGSFKLMPGYTLEHPLKIDSESGEFDDDLDQSKKRDTSFGLDLGVLYKPSALSGFSLGIVGKNLNTPEFDTISGGKMEVDPQFRAGLAYDLLGERITLALDTDLTRNETFIPDYDSQYIGGGIRFQPLSWFSLRGGAMKNIVESNEGTILTAGLGLGVKWFSIDIAGQFSSKDVVIDNNRVPKYGKVELNLSSRWF